MGGSWWDKDVSRYRQIGTRDNQKFGRDCGRQTHERCDDISSTRLETPYNQVEVLNMSIARPAARSGLKRCLASRSRGTAQIRHNTSSTAPAAQVAAKLLASPADEQEKELFGFVRSIRKQKQNAFAAIGDGSSLEPVQAVLTPDQAQR
jgi:hypothetical protein